jgi:hypothetical protein
MDCAWLVGVVATVTAQGALVHSKPYLAKTEKHVCRGMQHYTHQAKPAGLRVTGDKFLVQAECYACDGHTSTAADFLHIGKQMTFGWNAAAIMQRKKFQKSWMHEMTVRKTRPMIDLPGGGVFRRLR